jgi:hypothetical protein
VAQSRLNEGGRVHLASRRFTLVAGGVLLVLAGMFPVLVALADQWSISDVATPLIVELPYVAVGFVIARRQPRNPVGWIILVSGVMPLLASDCNEYAWIVYGLGNRSLPLGELAVFLSIGGFLIFGSLPLALMLFPDGWLPRGRWRWAFWVNVVALSTWAASTIAVAALDLVEHGVRELSQPGGGSVDIVINTPRGWFALVLDVVAPTIVACWLLATVRLVEVWRNSSGALSQQLECVLVGISVCILAAIALLSGTANGGSSLVAQVWSQIPWVCFSALPIAIGVGILRYHLYEIDRLISRTLSYAIITGLLIGVYFGSVTLATRVLPFSSPVGVAASTLAAVALFSPLRTRVQHLVDRRFNRARYNAEVIVATFTAQLRDAVDLETVHTHLVDVVDRTLAPGHASLWIRSRR